MPKGKLNTGLAKYLAGKKKTGKTVKKTVAKKGSSKKAMIAADKKEPGFVDKLMKKSKSWGNMMAAMPNKKMKGGM